MSAPFSQFQASILGGGFLECQAVAQSCLTASDRSLKIQISMGRKSRSLDSQLFSPSISEWINRVARKQKQLAGLPLNDDRKGELERFLARRFVESLFELDGEPIDPALLDQAVSTAGRNLFPSPVANAAAAYRLIRNLAKEKGHAASLSTELLRELHSPLTETPALFRAAAGTASGTPAVSSYQSAGTGDAERTRISVEIACRWFGAESFLELTPVEQAAIVLLRIVEISPFESGNDRTARISASLFTLRAGLPPLILGEAERAAYSAALDEARRISTRPMVELLASGVEKTLVELFERASAPG
jgi:hypothetical protein